MFAKCCPNVGAVPQLIIALDVAPAKVARPLTFRVLLSDAAPVIRAVPATCRSEVGEFVPTPTLPALVIRMVSVAAELANTKFEPTD